MKKFLSLLLALFVLLSLAACGSGNSADEKDGNEKVENADKNGNGEKDDGNKPLTEEDISKIKEEADATVDSLPVAEDFAWKLEDGVLTISGNGNMPDYSEERPSFGYVRPWGEVKDEITKVVIEDGITSIGAYAFQRCTNITEVEIADSVRVIKSFAFDYCTNLDNVVIPGSVLMTHMFVFNGCTKLQNIEIKNGLVSIGEGTFDGCKSLTEITIPSSVVKMIDGVFSNSITDINFGGTIAQWEALTENLLITKGATIHCSDGDIEIPYN